MHSVPDSELSGRSSAAPPRSGHSGFRPTVSASAPEVVRLQSEHSKARSNSVAIVHASGDVLSDCALYCGTQSEAHRQDLGASSRDGSSNGNHTTQITECSRMPRLCRRYGASRSVPTANTMGHGGLVVSDHGYLGLHSLVFAEHQGSPTSMERPGVACTGVPYPPSSTTPNTAQTRRW
jgi:hypothetical protein